MNAIGEYRATNIGELLNSIVDISRRFGNIRPWWRGHGNFDWQLTPNLYRKAFAAKEVNMNQRFRMLAKVRHVKCPENHEALPWLFLMQHYRLPTRLLDWSESPLIALYFAVESKVNEGVDAAIWGLSPTGLNQSQMGKSSICMPGSSSLGKLPREAFVRNTNNPDIRILSVVTEQLDLRHMAQQSVFTIHGIDTSIEELPQANNFLAKIRVPSESKKGFRQLLEIFGISKAYLFPDLENLAHEIMELDFNNFT